VLDRLSTFVDAVALAGDVNIRLERKSDPQSVEFCDLLDGYSPTQHVTGATHDVGGTIDVVCTRDDMTPPNVGIIDVGISDHRLLRKPALVIASTAPATSSQYANSQVVESFGP